MFFHNIVEEDRSVLEFIDADYTFLNERLARFLRDLRRQAAATSGESLSPDRSGAGF